MAFYPPSIRYGFHPYWPERLGYRRMLALTNPRLARLLRDTDDFTLVSGRNRTTLVREARKVMERGVAGDFAEIGVHRGGSAGVLAALIKADPTRQLHLFDRWGDLPEPTDEDGHRKSEYSRANIPEKLAYLRDDPPLDATRKVVEKIVGMPEERVHYHQGWYDESFAAFAGGPFAFVSLDCDYYASVKAALAFLKERMSPGSVVIVDDYGSWPGSKQATEEFVAENSQRVRIVPMMTGPAILSFAAD